MEHYANEYYDGLMLTQLLQTPLFPEGMAKAVPEGFTQSIISPKFNGQDVDKITKVKEG